MEYVKNKKVKGRNIHKLGLFRVLMLLKILKDERNLSDRARGMLCLSREGFPASGVCHDSILENKIKSLTTLSHS